MTLATTISTTPTTSAPNRPSADPLRGLDPQLVVSLAGVDRLLERGMPTAARRLLGQVHDRATGSQRVALADLVAAHETSLGGVFEQRFPRLVRWVAPSRVQRRRGERVPADERAARGARAHAAAAAAEYVATQPEETTDTRGRDADDGVYDGDLGQFEALALVPLNGPACLFCRLERLPRDLGWPDGLCSDCREAGHTRASVLQGYCELVTGDVDRARAQLTALWRRFPRPADREVLGAWVKAHPERYAAA